MKTILKVWFLAFFCFRPAKTDTIINRGDDLARAFEDGVLIASVEEN